MTPIDGFNRDVALTATGLPANVTASFSSATLSSPYTTTSTLTLTGAGAAGGTSTVTVTGTAAASGTDPEVTRRATFSLTVTSGPPLHREYIYLGGRVIAVESP